MDTALFGDNRDSIFSSKEQESLFGGTTGDTSDALFPKENTEGLGFNEGERLFEEGMKAPESTPYEELRKRAKRRPIDAMDIDPDGRATAALGKEKGKTWDRDTIIGLDVFGEKVDADTLRSMEGGEALLDLAKKKRTGRRGFFEALKSGTGWDFVPFAGDLASTGIAIKNMSKVRDTFRKMENGEQVSLQEKVLAKLYEEESFRASQTTLMGTVASIVRAAPAFAAEFALTGGLFSLGKKAVTTAAAKGTKEIAEEIAMKTVNRRLITAASGLARTQGGRAAVNMSDDMLRKVIKESADEFGEETWGRLAKEVSEDKLFTMAKGSLELYRNPSYIKAFGEGMLKYAKRGAFDHGGDVIRDLPPGIGGKLAEAAGVAFLEAPIKGAMYGAFDFFVANPIIAKTLGAEETVTRNELGLTYAGAMNHDKELMDNAKMLAFGTAVAEYASENAGRAFSALGGILTENVAGAVGKTVLKRGIRATAGGVPGRILDETTDIIGGEPVKKGSFMRQVMTELLGDDKTLKATLLEGQQEAVDMAFTQIRAGGDDVAQHYAGLMGKNGKTLVESIKAGSITPAALMEKGMEEARVGLMRDKFDVLDKSFMSYVIADKMINHNVLPGRIQSLFEVMGYDGILGEFMEERYNGFAQGFFNLDGTPSKGFMDRLAKGIDQGFKPGGEQAMAELLAFAIPIASRTAVNKVFQTVGASNIEKIKEFMDFVELEKNSYGASVIVDDKIARVNLTESGTVATEAREGMGVVEGNDIKYAGQFKGNRDVVERIYPSIAEIAKYLHRGDTGALGWMSRAARSVVGMLSSGDPVSAWFGVSPERAAVIEKFGRRGGDLVDELSNLYRGMIKEHTDLQASKTAAVVTGGARSQNERETPEIAEASFAGKDAREAIKERFLDVASGLVAKYRMQSGVVSLDASSQKAWVQDFFDSEKVVDGKYAGMTQDEFYNAFKGEVIKSAADGDIRFDVVSGVARPSYQKSPNRDSKAGMLELVESYLESRGVDTATDVDDPYSKDGTDAVRGMLRAVSGVGMGSKSLESAAIDETEKGIEARYRLIRMGVIPIRSGESWESRLAQARKWAGTARLLLDEYADPTYEKDGRTYRARKDSGGVQFLRDVQTGERLRDFSFQNESEILRQNGKPTGVAKKSAQLYLSGTGQIRTRWASMLMHPVMGTAAYLEGRRSGGLPDGFKWTPGKEHPFAMGLADEDADRMMREELRLAAAWDTASKTEGGIDALVKEEMARQPGKNDAEVKNQFTRAFDRVYGKDKDGYEHKTAELASLRRIEKRQNPHQRNDQVYTVMPGAMNFGGEVYLPFRHASSTTAMLEEFIEIRSSTKTIRVMDENGNTVKAFGIFRDPRFTSQWRPSAKTMVEELNKALTALRTRKRAEAVAGDKAAEVTVKEADALITMFNPKAWNHEAESKMINAVAAFQGHAALGLGGASTGMAFYSTLGQVIREATANTEAYDGIISLANRLSREHEGRGGGMLRPAGTRGTSDPGNILVDRLARIGVPEHVDSRSLISGADGKESSPMEEPQRAAIRLQEAYAQALKGMTRAKRPIALSEAEEKLLHDRVIARLNLSTSTSGGNVRAEDLLTDSVTGYFQEDLPYIVQEEYDSLFREHARIDINPATPADESGVEAAGLGIAEEPLSKIEPAVQNSLLEVMLTEHPEFSSAMIRALRDLNGEGQDTASRVTADDVVKDWQRISGDVVSASARADFENFFKKNYKYSRVYSPDDDNFTSDEDNSGSQFDADAQARKLEKAMAHGIHRVFGEISKVFLPHANGDLLQVREYLLAGIAEDTTGYARDVSLAGLFDESAWEASPSGIHPALESDEAFEDYLNKAQSDRDKPYYKYVKAFAKTAGRFGMFDLLSVTVGAYRRGMLRLSVEDKDVTNTLSMPQEIRSDLSHRVSRLLKHSTEESVSGSGKKVFSSTAAKDAETELSKIIANGAIPSTVKEDEPYAEHRNRIAAWLTGRMEAYANVVDKLFQPGNPVSGILRDRAFINAKADEVAYESRHPVEREGGRDEFGQKSTKLAYPVADGLRNLFGTYDGGMATMSLRLQTVALRMKRAAQSLAEQNATEEQYVGAAVALTDELLRGDSLDLAARANGKTEEKLSWYEANSAGDRGTVSFFLNAYYANIPMGTVKSDGINRDKKVGTAVRGLIPGQSAGMYAFLRSDAATRVYESYGVKAGSAEHKSYVRNAVWPDGTPVFSNVTSLKRMSVPVPRDYDEYYDGEMDERRPGVTVSDPTPAEIERLISAQYLKGERVAHFMPGPGEKTPFLVSIPRQAVTAFAGLEADVSYDVAYKAVINNLGADMIGPKRFYVVGSMGETARIKDAKFGLFIDAAGGALKGGIPVSEARFMPLMELAAGDSAGGESLKYHIASVGDLTVAGKKVKNVLAVKGEQLRAPKGVTTTGIAQLTQQAITDTGVDAILDLDSLKESPLTKAKGEGASALDHLLAGRLDAKVTLSGETFTVGELAKTLNAEVRRDIMLGDGKREGVMVLFTVPGVTHMVYAAAPDRKSVIKDIGIPADALRRIMATLQKERVNLTKLLLHVEEGQGEYDNPVMRRLIEDAMVDTVNESPVLKALASKTGDKIEALPWGDPLLQAPFGQKLLARLRELAAETKADGMKNIETPNAKVLPADESYKAVKGADAMDPWRVQAMTDGGDARPGRKITAADGSIMDAPPSSLVNVSTPGFRYDMKLAKGVTADEFWRRLQKCVGVVKTGKTQEYLALLADGKDGFKGLLENMDGTKTPDGQFFQFLDLFDLTFNERGELISETPDLSSTESTPEGLIVRGTRRMDVRTPHDNDASKMYSRASAPVSTVKADGTDKYTYLVPEKVTMKDKSGLSTTKWVLSKKPVPVGTPVPGPGAQVRRDTASQQKAGLDHDGDSSGGFLIAYDKKTGMPRFYNAAKYLEALAKKGATVEELLNEHDKAVRAISNAMAIELTRMGANVGELPGWIGGLLETFVGWANAGRVESTLFTDGVLKFPGHTAPDFTDSKAAAEFATMAAEIAGRGRGLAVTCRTGILDYVIPAGIELTAFSPDPATGAFAPPVLTAPAALSPEGKAAWARVFGGKGKPDAESARFLEFMLSVLTNGTYDFLKDGLAITAGITPATMDLYAFLAYNSGVKDLAGFKEFHSLWLAWLKSDEGKAIEAMYRLDLDPDGHTDTANVDKTARAAIKQYEMELQRKGTLDPYKDGILSFMRPGSASKIVALASERGVSASTYEGLRRVAELIRGMQSVAEMKRALDWNKMDGAFVDKMERLEKDVRNAGEAIVGGKKKLAGLNIPVREPRLMALLDASQAWLAVTSRAHSGSIEKSKLARELKTLLPQTKKGKILKSTVKVGADGALSATVTIDKEPLQLIVERFLPFRATLDMTPKETQEKIDRVIPGKLLLTEREQELVAFGGVSQKPVRFPLVVEQVWSRFFRAYSDQYRSGKIPSNDFISAVLAPSTRNRMPTIGMASASSGDSLPTSMREGLTALRDGATKVHGVPEGTIPFTYLDKDGNKVTEQFTASDIYYLLLQYSALAAPRSLTSVRERQSMLPAFGLEVQLEISRKVADAVANGLGADADTLRLEANAVSELQSLYEGGKPRVFHAGYEARTPDTGAGEADLLQAFFGEGEIKARGYEPITPVAAPKVLGTKKIPEQPKTSVILREKGASEPMIELDRARASMYLSLAEAGKATKDAYLLPAVIKGGLGFAKGTWNGRTKASAQFSAASAARALRLLSLDYTARGLPVAASTANGVSYLYDKTGYRDPGATLALVSAVQIDANILAAAGETKRAQEALNEYSAMLDTAFGRDLMKKDGLFAANKALFEAAMNGQMAGQNRSDNVIAADLALAAGPKAVITDADGNITGAVTGEMLVGALETSVYTPAVKYALAEPAPEESLQDFIARTMPGAVMREVKAEGSDKTKHVYDLPDGRTVDSITTKIGDFSLFFFDRETRAKQQAEKRSMTVAQVMAEWNATSEEGTVEHKILEDLLSGKLETSDRADLVFLRDFLRAKGAVATEFIAWAGEDAGTVDVLVRKADGTYALYDLKTMKSNPHIANVYNETYRVDGVIEGESKGERHRVQIEAYRRVLAMRGLDVTETYIIPLSRETKELYRAENADTFLVDATATPHTKSIVDAIFGEALPNAETTTVGAQAPVEDMEEGIDASAFIDEEDELSQFRPKKLNVLARSYGEIPRESGVPGWTPVAPVPSAQAEGAAQPSGDVDGETPRENAPAETGLENAEPVVQPRQVGEAVKVKPGVSIQTADKKKLESDMGIVVAGANSLEASELARQLLQDWETGVDRKTGEAFLGLAASQTYLEDMRDKLDKEVYQNARKAYTTAKSRHAVNIANALVGQNAHDARVTFGATVNEMIRLAEKNAMAAVLMDAPGSANPTGLTVRFAFNELRGLLLDERTGRLKAAHKSQEIQGEFQALMLSLGSVQGNLHKILITEALALESFRGQDRAGQRYDASVRALVYLHAALAVGRTGVHAVRGSENPQFEELLALEDGTAIAADRETSLSEAMEFNERTGYADEIDAYDIKILGTDFWIASFVLPDYDGLELRDVLQDGTTEATATRFLHKAEDQRLMLGLGDEGMIRFARKEKASGITIRDGKYSWESNESLATRIKYLRSGFFRDELGHKFSREEYALVDFFSKAVYMRAGSAKDRANVPLGNILEVSDLPWKTIYDVLPVKWASMTDIELVETFMDMSAKRVAGVAGRTYKLDIAMENIANNVPAVMRTKALATILRAIGETRASTRFEDAWDNENDPEQVFLHRLNKRGWLYARERKELSIDGSRTRRVSLYDARFAIPVNEVDAEFKGRAGKLSSALEKLIAAGRESTDFDMEKLATELRSEYLKAKTSYASIGWLADAEGKMMLDNGPMAPLFRGGAFYQADARKRDVPPTPEYRDEVEKAYDSLEKSVKASVSKTSLSGWKTVASVADNQNYARMLQLYRDLNTGTRFEGNESAETVARLITSDPSFRNVAPGFGTPNALLKDLATEIYRLSVRKLHETAWRGGLVKKVDLKDAGYEGFMNAMERAAAEENVDFGSIGPSFHDIYNMTGALPANLTSYEALGRFGRDMGRAIKYRAALNASLLTKGPDGKPLIIMRPGEANDDTIQDVVWQAAARYWIRSYGRPGDTMFVYDESKSGRENAKKLYDMLRDVRTTGFTKVTLPPEVVSVSEVMAAQDPADDPTYAILNKLTGGEASGMMEQLFAVGGFMHRTAIDGKLNRVLTWSKSMSVMFSWFFPIATVFESQVAASGMTATLSGFLPETGRRAVEKMAKGKGWFSDRMKDMGLDAPKFMDFLDTIGSDDPALIKAITHANLVNAKILTRVSNITDHDKSVLLRDIDSAVAMVRNTYGNRAAQHAKAVMNGLLDAPSTLAFEYFINATKMAALALATNRAAEAARKAGRWFDPVRDMREWAREIGNPEIGGIDFTNFAYMTPRFLNVMKVMWFSWEWTFGAWLAGGGGVLTRRLFGMSTGQKTRAYLFGRWARMYFHVMWGVPALMQLAAYGIGSGSGDDDDDKVAMWKNEPGRAHDADITPLLRRMGNSPFIGGLKKMLPRTVLGIPFGDLIPGLTGDEGDMKTTGKRRYYMHFGKQGWEVANWFINPYQSFTSKMSMPVQRTLEGLSGKNPSMGWDMPFSELGFWERWFTTDMSKSATANLAGAFLPFSVAGISRAPEAGALSAVGIIRKGTSKTTAVKDMKKIFTDWADADSYAALAKTHKGAWTDMRSMVIDHLDALRINGYDPKVELKAAMAEARAPLYEEIQESLPQFPNEKADVARLERASRGLLRLNYIHRDLMKSIKSRDKNRHIDRTGDLKLISNQAIRESFLDPYGRGVYDTRKSQSADLGGDVSAFLASDELPQTVLGYKVVPPNEITEKDVKFFQDNPSAAGFFRTGKE